MFGVPPNTFAIGYVHNMPLGSIALQYSKQLQEGLMVLSDDFLHFLKIKIFLGQIHQNYISCGFKI